LPSPVYDGGRLCRGAAGHSLLQGYQRRRPRPDGELSRCSPASVRMLPAKRCSTPFAGGWTIAFMSQPAGPAATCALCRPEGREKPSRCAGKHSYLILARTSLRLTSGGGQHGMCMDDWGHAFVCANSDPIHLIMYDDRYLGAEIPTCRRPPAAVNIAPGGKRNTKLFRISENETVGACCGLGLRSQKARARLR